MTASTTTTTTTTASTRKTKVIRSENRKTPIRSIFGILTDRFIGRTQSSNQVVAVLMVAQYFTCFSCRCRLCFFSIHLSRKWLPRHYCYLSSSHSVWGSRSFLWYCIAISLWTYIYYVYREAIMSFWEWIVNAIAMVSESILHEKMSTQFCVCVFLCSLTRIIIIVIIMSQMTMTMLQIICSISINYFSVCGLLFLYVVSIVDIAKHDYLVVCSFCLLSFFCSSILTSMRTTTNWITIAYTLRIIVSFVMVFIFIFGRSSCKKR